MIMVSYGEITVTVTLGIPLRKSQFLGFVKNMASENLRSMSAYFCFGVRL